MAAKKATTAASPWRKSIPVEPLLEPVQTAAVQLGRTEAMNLVAEGDPGDTKLRADKAELVFDVIREALAAVASGGTTSFQVGDQPEPYFARARKEIRDGELKAQFDAIADFLGVEPNPGIAVTEAELIAGAIKAADVLKYPRYTVEDLLHEGVRRVAQELISNAVNLLNAEDPTSKPVTMTGRNWPEYDRALAELRAELGTAAWKLRKPFITVSTIAGRVNPPTNTIQIRRWLAAQQIPTIAPPTPEELRADPSLGGKVVDPALKN
jgi:hypothetical protein